MASPTATAATTNDLSGTSHSINVGSPVAGQLLVVFVRFAGAPGTVTFTGYTQLASDASDASDDQSMVFYRWADGTEGATDTVTHTTAQKMAAICWKIDGAVNPSIQAPQISTVAIGTTTANTANPGSVSGTGGSKDYLFLAMMGMDGEGGNPSAAPTNYTNLVAANTGTAGAVAVNCIVGGAQRALTAASDDPGVFTHAAAATGWTAWTVVVHPLPPPTQLPLVVKPNFWRWL